MGFLRLLRVFRIFRIAQRVPGLWVMLFTLRSSLTELYLLLVVSSIGTLFFSAVMFFLEKGEVFESIPHSFWWSIVTMTTVGYGDMAPVTALGKVLGAVCALFGVVIMGLTIPTLVNNFITFYYHVDFVVQGQKVMSENHQDNLFRGRNRRKLERVTDMMSELVNAGSMRRGKAPRKLGALQELVEVEFPHRR